MSRTIVLPDSLSIDSRLTVGSSKTAEIRRGSSQATVQRSVATSVSNNQVVFNVQLNSAASTIIDPYCYVELPVQVTVTAQNLLFLETVQNYVQNYFAPRQYPISSVTAVAQCQINNQSSTSTPAQFIHQLSQFQNFVGDETQASVQSICPVMPDQSPQYADSAGTLKSPLNTYFVGGEHYTSSRGEFLAAAQTTTNTNTQWVFNMTFREPIFNPLLDYYLLSKREGLAYVSLMNIQLNFTSNLSRMFSLDIVSAPNVTGVEVNVLGATLVQTWLTAPVDLQLPPVALRSFNTIVANVTNSQASFAPGQQLTIQSQSYSMNQIAKKIWVYVVDSALDVPTGYQKSDYCFSIQQISVLFNNRSALMSNMNSVDLYNACMASEGCKMTYIQSQYFTGTVLCLDPALLFGLLDNEAPGLLGNYQLQIQVQCTNISQATVTPNLWVTWAMDTILSTDSHSITNLSQGFLTQEDVMAARALPARAASFAETHVYGGANFFDSLKKFLGPIAKFARDTKLVSSALSAFPQSAAFAPAAAALGYGRTPRRQMIQRALRY